MASQDAEWPHTHRRWHQPQDPPSGSPWSVGEAHRPATCNVGHLYLHSFAFTSHDGARSSRWVLGPTALEGGLSLGLALPCPGQELQGQSS